jgi:hypothetical protein
MKKDEMGWLCSARGEKRNTYKILVGKLEETRPGETRSFATLVHTVLLKAGKLVLKITEALWKNSHIIAKMYELSM